MYKELVISIIIVVSIFVLDYITQRYTDEIVKSTTSELKQLEEMMKSDNVENEEAKKKVNNIYKKLLEDQKKLSFYIEHTELEKVETNLISGRSLVESAEFGQAIAEIEKTIFVLEHIQAKYAFNIKNIF